MITHGYNQQNPKRQKFYRADDSISSTNEWQWGGYLMYQPNAMGDFLKNTEV